MGYSQVFRDRVREIDAEKKALDAQRAETLSELQASCSHDTIAEIPYASGLFLDNLPRRICIFCALEEEGWMFRALHGKGSHIVKVRDRDEFWGYRKLVDLKCVAVPA